MTELEIERDYIIHLPQDIMEKMGFEDEMDITIDCQDKNSLVIKKL